MDTNSTAVLDDVTYPESDGKPMADNTLQWDWMVKIVGELRELFAGQNVFVAGNLFWYPVEGDPKTVTAPDALVVFGRPPGYRGSYKQWEEDGITPQVVFEVLSPSNTREEMEGKLLWYDRFGVEEYYFIDPYKNQLSGWIRRDGHLLSVYPMAGFVSPRLKISFDVNGEIALFAPGGRQFREDRFEEFQEELRKTSQAFEEERERVIQAEQQARDAEERGEQERLRAEQERVRAEQERIAKDLLAEKLRELGVNPDELLKPKK